MSTYPSSDITNIVIVGSGIIGLSIAEYFSARSEKYHTTIISNCHPLSGSFAAAANLGLKGQFYARDQHFQIKLEAQKSYPNWIAHLLKEAKTTIKSEEIYRHGLGIDHFSNEAGRDKQLIRVRQPKEILQSKNLPLDSITIQSHNQIIYQNEAWVDARSLMKVIWGILEKRAVSFIQESFSQIHLKKYSQQKNTITIFCTGAWSKSLLTELELPLPPALKGRERLTAGMTFFGKNIFENSDVKFVLQDKIYYDQKEKMTFSGPVERQTLSSLTIKLESLDFRSQNKKQIIENEKVDTFLNLAKLSFENSPFLKENVNLEQVEGFRVGYGPSEIAVEQIFLNTSLSSQGLICAGAHKSGFLFAPMMGEKIESLFLRKGKNTK